MADLGGGRRRSSRRWLWIVAGIAAVGAVAAVVGIWHLPDRMYPPGTDGGAEARAALQGGLLTAAAALTAVAGALIALDETRQANAEVRRANENTHVRELYATAISQIGSDTIDVRLGGIYALERIAVDSPDDQRTVVEVLSAFIREHTRLSSTGTPEADRRPTTDVQAALTVLGRLPARDGVPRADLNGANLTRAVLAEADLTGAWLLGADLTHADLLRANLTEAVLVEANLAHARGDTTNLTRAWMSKANLTGAMMTQSNFSNAQLFNTNFTGAWLFLANFTDAHMSRGSMRANFTDASLLAARGLTADQVAVAIGSAGTFLPEEVERPESWPSYDLSVDPWRDHNRPTS
ncbi:hypothetical protein CcI49_02925 [Frankia sp. CcI49]|uniref:pentapeptide repeat-containing protein n=1 Tax=Frankia sp. CcI49 TaxID=1745382 RepID=UPI0009770DE4|nr:pentapeptide repeat-containing protein [Frankia sp. CcI49]ONH62348.1 hypothetical protein CcI49_02925 [Frankia sp. CcI49]